MAPQSDALHHTGMCHYECPLCSHQIEVGVDLCVGCGAIPSRIHSGPRPIPVARPPRLPASGLFACIVGLLLGGLSYYLVLLAIADALLGHGRGPSTTFYRLLWSSLGLSAIASSYSLVAAAKHNRRSVTWAIWLSLTVLVLAATCYIAFGAYDYRLY